MKCDGTLAESTFRLSAKRTSPFKSAGEASVQSTTGSRSVRISGNNAGYTTFRRSVKGTGYTLHSPVSPSLSLPCVTVCHHIPIRVYLNRNISLLFSCRTAQKFPVYSNRNTINVLHRSTFSVKLSPSGAYRSENSLSIGKALQSCHLSSNFAKQLSNFGLQESNPATASERSRLVNDCIS